MDGRVGASLGNDGRNEIRVNNSAGRCLLENWVEERANYERDPPLDREYNMLERADFLKRGHPGLLTVHEDAKAQSATTVRVNYTPPQVDTTRKVGSRKHMMEKAFVKAVSEEMQREEEEQIAEQEKGRLCTIFMQDYTKDFPKTVPEQTKDHDYVRDMPVTFWSEHTDKIHGVSQVKTRDTAFRKNDAFSKPIGEYWDEPKTTELDQYPMM